MKSPRFDCFFKINILGDKGVGKSALVARYLFDTINPTEKEKDFLTHPHKYVELENVKINLVVETTRWMSEICFRGSQAAIYLYDVTNPSSLANVKIWVNESEKYLQKNAIKAIVGTKCDLPHKVDRNQVKELADSLDISLVFEVSSADSTNIEELFSFICLQIIYRVFSLYYEKPKQSSPREL